MVFGQTREQKINQLQPQPKPKIAEEPVIPTGNISIVNLEQKKNLTMLKLEIIIRMNQK